MEGETDHRDPEPESGQNEFLWTLRRFFLLAKYWTTPLDSAVPIPAEDQNSVRAFALFLIVSLTFAIRADPTGGGTYAAVTGMAGAVAAFMSAVLSTLSDRFNLRIRNEVLISAYASTISVMFLYIFVDQYFSGLFWYEALNGQFGKTIVTVILSAAISYCLLIAKAILLDHHKFTLLGLFHGVLLVAGSGLIVLCISTLSTPAFNYILKMLNQAVS